MRAPLNWDNRSRTSGSLRIAASACCWRCWRSAASRRAGESCGSRHRPEATAPVARVRPAAPAQLVAQAPAVRNGSRSTPRRQACGGVSRRCRSSSACRASSRTSALIAAGIGKLPHQIGPAVAQRRGHDAARGCEHGSRVRVRVRVRRAAWPAPARPVWARLSHAVPHGRLAASFILRRDFIEPRRRLGRLRHQGLPLCSGCRGDAAGQPPLAGLAAGSAGRCGLAGGGDTRAPAGHRPAQRPAAQQHHRQARRIRRPSAPVPRGHAARCCRAAGSRRPACSRPARARRRCPDRRASSASGTACSTAICCSSSAIYSSVPSADKPRLRSCIDRGQHAGAVAYRQAPRPSAAACSRSTLPSMSRTPCSRRACRRRTQWPGR